MGIDLLVALGAGVLAALAGWPITRWVLRGAARELRALPGDVPDEDQAEREERAEGGAASPALEAPSASDGPADTSGAQPGEAAIDAPGLLRGGFAIGLLERFLVAGGIALGQPAVLAVVVAVKGLGRIPELRVSRAAGERFIIGTFASLAVAGILGFAGRYLAGLV